jgi:hypothetical protein
MVWHLDRLITRDQCRHRDDAPVSRRKIGTLPLVARKTVLRVPPKRWRNHPNIFRRQHWRDTIRFWRGRRPVGFSAGQGQ